jgi:hypothetical protein
MWKPKNYKFRFQKFWHRPKHPCRHAHFLQTKIAMEGLRRVQLVSSFDKFTARMQTEKRKKKKK